MTFPPKGAKRKEKKGKKKFPQSKKLHKSEFRRKEVAKIK